VGPLLGPAAPMTAGGSLQMSRSRLPWRVEIVTKWGGTSNLVGGGGGFLIRAEGDVAVDRPSGSGLFVLMVGQVVRRGEKVDEDPAGRFGGGFRSDVHDGLVPGMCRIDDLFRDGTP
jgi:hypothetical protein